MADTRKIGQLLNYIEHEEYILPEFQRGYVWTPKQVKEYFNSLYRGYPSGSFLIWKTPHVQKSRGGHVETDNKYYKLILDGQQRLTSLYALFFGKPPFFYEGEHLFFNIYFNLNTEEFSYYMEKKMKGNLEWIPVTEFLKYGDAGEFIVKSTSAPDAKLFYTENLAKLVKLNNIRNYEYYLTEITDLNIDEVVTVFNLVNSSGTPLSKADLALAHICSYWPEARDIFKNAQKKFKNIHFDLGLDFLTVCISSIAVDSVLFEKSFYNTPKEIIKESWNKVEKALDYLINVLQSEAYIDSTSYLKTPFVLVPIIYYLVKNNFVFNSENNKKMFLYWMYHALMWGRYSGRTYQTLQSDLVNIKSTEKVESLIDALRRQRGGNLDVNETDLSSEGVSSRFFPMTYIVTRNKGAIDWFNGMRLTSKNIGPDYKIHIHHIFPQSVLYKNGYNSADSQDKRKVNELGNLAFLTQEANLKFSASKPLSYLIEVNNKYPNALKKQFMPNEDCWSLKRYDDFLTERRKLIARDINTFLGRLIDNKEVLETLSTENIISLGENEMIEFKSSFRWDYKLKQVSKVIEYAVLKTIAAFMNYNGGTLYIGITDEGEIVGIENDFQTLNKQNQDGFELILNQEINNSIGKEYRRFVHISFEHNTKGTICVVRVECSRTPAFLKFNGEKEFYIRSGNSSQSLDVEETISYIKSHWEEA